MAALTPSRRIAILILALCGASIASAQSVNLGPGSKLRFVRAGTPDRDTATGRRPREHTVTVLAARGDSVVVLPAEGAQYVIALGDLQRVRMSGGKSRLAGGGAGILWGAALGGVVGGLVGAVDAARCGSPCPRASAEELGLFGALTSIWSGALIGFAVGKEIWIPISVALHRPGGPASGAGARLSLSIPF